MRWVVALMLVLVGLAGCAGEGGSDDPGTVDTENFALAAGTGAIAGLLVDDRFRPLHLTDDPETEFEWNGFVLLQETGGQAQTTENGEFVFVDLAPGQYTVRATIDGHEATPQRITVREGVFNELSVVARRIASEGSAIVTEEYSAFVPCQASAFAATAQCHAILLDNSGDTNRQQFWTNYTGFETDWVVIEMLSNKDAARDGALKIVVRRAGDDCYLVNHSITEGNYMRVYMRRGEVSPFDTEIRNCEWDNESHQLVQIWAQGLLKDETMDGVGLVCLTGICAGERAESRGLGVQAGTTVRFLNSIFVGAPELDPTEYCVLC